jgi:hypothetical protein
MSNGGIIGPVNDPTKSDFKEAFNASGTFTSPIGATSGTLLVVAGGGGGGGSGGGGGAGGFRLITSHPFPASPVPVTIGAGGAGNPSVGSGSSGNPSSFGPITSTGGGFGYGLLGAPSAGGSGGSGGGGSGNSPTATSPGGAGNSPPVSPPQGNPGGPSSTDAATYTNGGGGGGASAAGIGGGPGPANVGGDGTSVIPTFGPTTNNPFYPPYPAPRAPEIGYFSGGGGGRSEAIPGSISGGLGGGGSGNTPATPSKLGIDNTGGGGGSATSGTGGSGFVGVLIAGAGPLQAPGVWSLSEAYNYKKAGNWTS